MPAGLVASRQNPGRSLPADLPRTVRRSLSAAVGRTAYPRPMPSSGAAGAFLRRPAGSGPPVEDTAPEVEVVIEIPRGGFLKRGSSGRIDFVSPLPCPYNYGAVPTLLGMDGDLLDALVLGPRLRRGSRLRLRAWGAVTLTDRGFADDKLVCAEQEPTAAECRAVLRFIGFYARCKALLNLWRGRPGRNGCDGWCDAREALARARPLDGARIGQAPVPF